MITPDKLRRIRIVLLKLTHWPYVAVIWAYESIDEYLVNSRGMREHSVSSLGGPLSGSAKKQQGRIYTPRAVAASLSQASLDGVGNAAPGLSSRPMARPLSMGQDDVRTMLMKLTSQVEHLATIVADQHQDQPHEDADAA
jgi:hypothetical protein